MWGSVVDASGGPIVGASIDALTPDGASELGATVSVENGSFTFLVPRERLELRARAEGYSAAQLSLDVPTGGVTLVLSLAGSIAGRVVNEATLQPTPATVTVQGVNGLGISPRRTLAGADGAYAFDELPAGAYELEAESDGQRSQVYSLELELGQSRSLDIAMASVTTLTGSVLVAGAPCVEGNLEVIGPSPSFTALDGQRSVRLGLSPGSYEVNAVCAGAVAERRRIEVGEVEQHLDFELQRGLTLNGRVESSSGAPVAGAPITVDPLFESSGPVALKACTTDASGKFACSGLGPGRYQCSVSAGVQGAHDQAVVEVGGAATPEVVLRLQAVGSIRVRLRNAEAARPPIKAFARSDGPPITATPDGESMVFEKLRLGSYDVYLAAGKEDGQASTRVALTRDGQERTIELTLPEPQALSGSVTDEQGAPVPDAWVSARVWGDGDNAGAPVLTDASGGFSLEGLWPGRYDLIASHLLGEASLSPVEAGSKNVVLTIPRYAALLGTVSNEEGGTVDTFRVECSGERQRASTWGSDGSWSIRKLVPGQYTVSVSSAAGQARTDVRLEAGAELHVPLVVGDAPTL